jgi:hypothetical protein
VCFFNQSSVLLLITSSGHVGYRRRFDSLPTNTWSIPGFGHQESTSSCCGHPLRVRKVLLRVLSPLKIRRASIIGAASTRQPPPFDPPTLSQTEISLPVLIAMDITDSVSMIGFQDDHTKALLGHRLLNLIAALHLPLKFKALCASGILRPKPNDYAIFVNNQQWAQTNLLRLPSVCSFSPWQESVRLAVLVAVMHTDVRFLPEYTYTSCLSQQLRQSCHECSPESGADQTRLFVWILFIGAILSKGLKERTWFVLKMAKICQQLHLNTRDQLRIILQRYIYLNWLFEDKFAESWKEIEVVSQSLDFFTT